MASKIGLALAASISMGSAWAGTAEIPAQIAGAMSVPVRSIKESRLAGTVIQQFDFSCGSAALATLLTHQYGTTIDERTVFEQMYERGDQTRIRREGFSLLDMKEQLARMGFEADGFEAPIDALATVGTQGIPGIVLLNEHGYNHFVVVKGLRAGHVLIGDPASGTRALSRDAFEKMWATRLLFVIGNRVERARFNDPIDWRAAPLAPIGAAAGFGSGSLANWAKLGSSDY